MNKLLVVLTVTMAACSFQASAASLAWESISGSGVTSGIRDSGQVTLQDLFGSVIKIANRVSISDIWKFDLSSDSQVQVNISSLKVNPTWLTSVKLDGNPLTQIGGIKNGGWLFDSKLLAGSHMISLLGTTNGGNSGYQINVDAPVITTQTPIPAAFWLFGSALIGMVSASRRKLA